MREDATQPPISLLPTLEAARLLIQNADSLAQINASQKAALAVAHYTLAVQEELPSRKAKLHVNSAISLLRSIKLKTHTERTQMALAYFKRSEMGEASERYRNALEDYAHTLYLLQMLPARDPYLRSLLAQSCISIADIILHQEVDCADLHLHEPLYYVRLALKELDTLKAISAELDEESAATLSFAHQMAGIILTTSHPSAALIAFEEALRSVGSTNEETAFPLLSDLYNCLGLLYQSLYTHPLRRSNPASEWNAFAYYGLALTFSPQDFDDYDFDDELFGLDALFELIQKVLSPESHEITQLTYAHLIDGLLYAHYGMMQNTLPNESITEQVQAEQAMSTFVLYLEQLLCEYDRRYHQNMSRLLDFGPVPGVRFQTQKAPETKAKILDFERKKTTNVEPEV